MRWITTIAREIFGLFVDDGSFAIAIIVWLGVTWLLFACILDAVAWSGVVLFVGLAAILAGSALRQARKSF